MIFHYKVVILSKNVSTKSLIILFVELTLILIQYNKRR